MSQFTNRQKVEVLDDVKRMGNVSKAAEKYGITRMTIYNWQKQEDEIRKTVSEDYALKTLRQSMGLEESVLQGIEEYADLLAQKGALEKRKQLLSANVEYILWKVVRLLENHPDLDGVHPKDLSKIMGDLHQVRKELSNEPTVIIEYRNEWMGRVLSVLQEFLDEDALREFAKKMQAVEAEYEVL
jgi:transposase